MTKSHVFPLIPLHDSFRSIGVHWKIHAHHAVVVLRCPGVPGWRGWRHADRGGMQPCKCELAIAALVRAADKRWMSVMIMNSCVTPVSFFDLLFSEELPLRWANCSFWLKAAGAAWQAALLPGEWARARVCFYVSHLRCCHCSAGGFFSWLLW